MRLFLRLALRFLSYRQKAVSQYKIHSPFVFDFYQTVILSKATHPIFEKIENRQKSLENRKESIVVTDYGAGSHWEKSNERKIARIAKSSKKATKWKYLLFKLIKSQYKDAQLIELGTSFGITTSYLATANLENQVTTFEGCPEIAKIAKETFQELHLDSVKVIVGNIDTTLPNFLNSIQNVDLVFFDANHRYEPTLRYFEQCLAKSTEESCFVFDDIYWSEEMQNAWETIKIHPKVTLSLDLFQLGIVFFRKKQPKQHFVLKA